MVVIVDMDVLLFSWKVNATIIYSNSIIQCMLYIAHPYTFNHFVASAWIIKGTQTYNLWHISHLSFDQWQSLHRQVPCLGYESTKHALIWSAFSRWIFRSRCEKVKQDIQDVVFLLKLWQIALILSIFVRCCDYFPMALISGTPVLLWPFTKQWDFLS